MLITSPNLGALVAGSIQSFLPLFTEGVEPPLDIQGYQAPEDSYLTAFGPPPNPESTLKVHRDNSVLCVDSELRPHPLEKTKPSSLKDAHITDEGWNAKLAVGSYSSVDTNNSQNQRRTFFAN